MLPLNELFEFTTENVISDEGVRQITGYLYAFTQQAWMGGHPYMPPLPFDFEFVWLAAEGKFTKRVSKYYYEMFRIRLPDEVISTVGNLAREHSTQAVIYRFQIVDKIDWQDGDFGDAGSCYWDTGGYANPILMIEKNGGYAICFFNEDGSGQGRAWLAHTGKFWVLWNGYGFEGNATLVIARVFAQWQRLPYRRINLTNMGMEDGTLYINGGVGYAFGYGLDWLKGYDLGWEEF